MTSEHQVLQSDDPILAEMVRRLTEAFQPERIYLFGSRARDGACPESDYDLLMVVKNQTPLRHRIARDAFRVLCGVGASKDVLVLTRSEFDRRRSVVCSLAATVEREGKLLFAA